MRRPISRKEAMEISRSILLNVEMERTEPKEFIIETVETSYLVTIPPLTEKCELNLLNILAAKHGYHLLKIDPELQFKDDDA